MDKKEIIVTDSRTGEIVKRIDVSDKSQNQIDKIEMGMLRNMDIENYYTSVVTS